MKNVLCGSVLLLAGLNGFAVEGTQLEILHSGDKVYFRAVDEVFYEVESSKKVQTQTECKSSDGTTFTAPAGSLGPV